MISIRWMSESDLDATAQLHALVFPRQQQSQQWLLCNLRGAPRQLLLVAEQHGEILGYILWSQKSGFRTEVVLELEQLAVTPARQGAGIGRRLITDSLALVRSQLASREAHIKHILVSTRADNPAQQLYASTLGAQVAATIPQLYSADEVLMIARNLAISP